MRERRSGYGVFVICLFFLVSVGATGCAPTKHFLGHLKFWGSKEPIREAEAQQEKGEEAVSPVLQPQTAKGNPDSHYRLGLHYQQRDRHGEAIEEFTKSIIIDPGYFKAYNAMGISYDNLREFDKAVECYRTAMKLAPNEAYIYNNLGYSLILKGDYGSAKEILEKGVALSPLNEQLHNNLALAYAGISQYELALRELNRTGNAAGALFSLGEILTEKGREEQASVFFKAALSLDPSLERKLSDKERSVTAMPESSKRVQTDKTGSVEKVVNRKRAAVPKCAGSNRAGEDRKLKENVDAKEMLPPDFLKNKTSRAADKGYGTELGKRPEGPIPTLVRGFFPGRNLKETNAFNLLEVRG